MNITLPLPPTTNATYKRGKNSFYKSDKAKDWMVEALAIIKQDKAHLRFDRIVKVGVYLFLKRDRDIDGSLKPLLDVLQLAKVVENDKQVYELYVKKHRIVENPRVELTILSI